MLRIYKIKTHYQKTLKNKGIKDVLNFIQSIIDVDITKGKYARFLIEAFLNDKFLEEDLIGGLESTVGQSISLFHKHKHKLPKDMRSVFKYTSPGDLWEAVKQFQGELSGKELKKEEQEQIYRETEFVYKDEETVFQIVSPLTEDSAKWWGKGTRWCTSADNNNMFEHYAQQSPLFILLIPNNGDTTGNGNKLQLWKSEYDIQFMDESDNNVSLEYIEQNWSVLEPVCKWLNDLRFIPEEYRTKELCELAVKQNGQALQLVPEELRIKELCEIAAKQDGLSLYFVPEELKTKKIYELAVQNNGYALEYVPEELRTPELCAIAVQNNGEALEYVPIKLRTKELCKLAVKENGFALEYVTEHLMTPELCESSVKNNALALEYIPEELKTKELCELVVKNNGYALQYIPEHLKTKELFKLAVQSNGNALDCVPKELRTKELCELAIQNNGYALKFVLEHLITQELCELAIQNSGYALQYVPEHLKTKELCKLAVKQNKNVLHIIPKELQNNFKQYTKDEAFPLPLDKYQETFQEMKTFF